LFGKICHITSVHPIDDVRIFIKECSSLASNGFDVTIIACGDSAFEDIKNGVKRISLYIPVKNRLQRMLRRSKAVYLRALQVNADIYHFHDPELIPVGLKLKKRNKIVIYDVHEDYPLNFLTKDWIPNVLKHLVAEVIVFFEKQAAKSFDAIVSVTPQIVDRFKKINKNSILVTNYPIIKNQLELRFNEKASNTFCYAGTINQLRMIHLIIQAMETVPDASFFLAGEVSVKYLERLKKLPSWKNVVFFGCIPHHQVLSLYSQSVFGIVIENYHPVNYDTEGSLGITKLFEFMQAGLPVVCSDFVLHKKIIDTYNCGIAINPNSILEIAETIKFFLTNPDKAKEMGKNGQKAVKETYNWTSQELVLINLYKKFF